MSNKQNKCRKWKSGKHWLYSAGILAVLVGGSAVTFNVAPLVIHSQAATTLPPNFNQIGTIGSAPLYQTSDTSWTTIQKGVDAMAKDIKADYVVGAVSKDGKGQAIGWWDGQTQFQAAGARQALGSLITANPNDLTQPNYNFVKKAMMSGADGFTDGDYFTYANSAGQPVAVHNVGQAYEVSSGKYIPVGLKVTINDATYYDGVNPAPRDAFSDGYKLMVAARNDGAGNITMGYVVVMTGVPAVDNGGGGEGGGGSGSGQTYGGATTGIPESVTVTISYVNEATGQVLPNNSLSIMKVADVDASQRAQVGQNALGYIISDPSNLKVDNNALTANNSTVVSSPGLSANSFMTIKTAADFSLKYTDTFGNQNQGSIIMALFGKNAATVPTPEPELTKNVLAKTQSTGSYPTGLTQAGAEFKLKNKSTGAFLKASDAVSADKPISTSNGTVGTATDGALKWTTGADGKVGAFNIPARDSAGKAITWEWVEVKAPKGEAISAPDGNQDFKADLNGTPDSNGNLGTTGTTIKDTPMVETGIAKINADSNGASTNGMPDMSGAEFTLKDADGNVMKQSQGINPATGKQANVKLINGAQYAPSANGNIVLVTNGQGLAGAVANVDLPSAEGLQWVETKAPDGFAVNDNPADVDFAKDNAIDNSTNNVMDNKANSSKISDKPLFEVQLDKDSTNAAFDNKLGDAVYELQRIDGTAVKQNQGLDPKTGDSANVVVLKGTMVQNPDNDIQVKLTNDGQADVKNLDGTLVGKDVKWVEIDPASGHALNQEAAKGSFDKDHLSNDHSNFLATSKTTDKPLGESEIAKLDADTGDNTTQGAGTLEGAEFTLVDKATQTPVKQSQGVDPKTGLPANVVLRPGAKYAPDANGNIVLVTDATGSAHGVQNIDLTNNLNYQWIESKAPYGYTISDKPVDVTFGPDNKVDDNTNNYEDDKELGSTVKDRIVDFGFSFIKTATDNGATFLNDAEFKLIPQEGTTNSLGQFDNGKDTNINGQDTYIDPNTGLATPVTDVNQLYLGDTQVSHDWTDPQGGTSAGRVEYDHVQVGKYHLIESKVPDGHEKMHDLEISILPETITNGAPDEYEFKVKDLVTGNVLRDSKIKVSYHATENGRPLINDNNFLGDFSLGSIFDEVTPPPVPSIDVEKADKAMPTAGKGNDTDAENNVGPNDRDTKDTALVIKDGESTAIHFLFTNNGEDDLTQLKPVDKTINGDVDVKEIKYSYNGTELTLNKEGLLTTSDGKLFVLPVGKAIQATGTLAALPAGQLHTDQVDINAIGVKSNQPVHDKDTWNGAVPKPSVDIEKANGGTPAAGQGNHTDKADNLGANDHDTKDGFFVIKDGEETELDFRATNNGTEDLTHVSIKDMTTDGSVEAKDFVWSYEGQTLKINKNGEFETQNGELLVFQVGKSITGKATLPALPAGELHGDDVTVKGTGVLSGKPVEDDDKWHGKVKEKPSIDVEKANDILPNTGLGNHADKADNVGANDHDTEATLLEVKDKATTRLEFRLTNNGNEILTNLKASDTTLKGSIKAKDFVWKYKDQTLKTDQSGYFTLPDGKLLNLPIGESLTATAILPALPAGELHTDEIKVSAEGLYSHKPVGDEDLWNGKVIAHPSIDVEKTNGGVFGKGNGNGGDKADNVKNDHDTKETAAELKVGQTIEIDFNFTNNGNETLIDLKPVDKTIDGKVDVTKITYSYKGKNVTVNKDGYFVLDGKRLELGAGETITGKGTLEGLEAGSTHGDEISISGIGKYSKTPVGDKDEWHGKTPQNPTTPPVYNIIIPNTGEKIAGYLTALGFLLMSGLAYLKIKKDKKTSGKSED